MHESGSPRHPAAQKGLAQVVDPLDTPYGVAMIIPLEELDEDVLTAIIEQFVLQEGTDYGEQEYSLAQKVAHVRRQLERGESVVVYSEEYETVNILPRRQVENS